jgi:hypothetical protein
MLFYVILCYFVLFCVIILCFRVSLQVNLSCNFFKGSFDVPRYIDFVDEYWSYCEHVEAAHGLHGYKCGPVDYSPTGFTPTSSFANLHLRTAGTAGAGGAGASAGSQMEEEDDDVESDAGNNKYKDN